MVLARGEPGEATGHTGKYTPAQRIDRQVSRSRPQPATHRYRSGLLPSALCVLIVLTSCGGHGDEQGQPRAGGAQAGGGGEGETVAGNGHGDGQAGNERKSRNPAGTDQGGRQSALEGRRVEEAGCMHRLLTKICTTGSCGDWSLWMSWGGGMGGAGGREEN